MKPYPTLAAIWTAVVLALCWTPKSAMPVGEEPPPGFFFIRIPHFDKVVHAGIFLVLAYLWARAIANPGRAWRVLVVGLTLAAVTELGQETRVVNRDADPLDFLADAGGLALGIAAAAGLEARARLKRSRAIPGPAEPT